MTSVPFRRFVRNARRKMHAALGMWMACTLAVALLVPAQGLASDDDDFEVFGEISEMPDRDPEEEAKAKLTPQFRSALEAARKRHCANGGILFPFEWQGDIEMHGCKVHEERCYVDSKLVRPGAVWACGKEKCQCGEDGQVRKVPKGSKKK